MVWQACRWSLPLQEVWAGEQWNSDIAVSCTLAKHSDVQSEKTTLWFSPLTRICSDVEFGSLHPLLFLRSVSILSHCPIINISCCHRDVKLSWTGPMACHPLTRFHYSKFLTYPCHDYGRVSTISGMNVDGSEYRQVLNSLGLNKHFWPKNYMVW